MTVYSKAVQQAAEKLYVGGDGQALDGRKLNWAQLTMDERRPWLEVAASNLVAEAAAASTAATAPAPSAVEHPAHYGGGDNPYETIKVLEAWFSPEQISGFLLGNAVKYISRAGKKDAGKLVEDLEKARWYLDREIARLRKL